MKTGMHRLLLAVTACELLWPCRALHAQKKSGDKAVGRSLVDQDAAAETKLQNARRLAEEKKYEQSVWELHGLMKGAGPAGLVAHSENPRRYEPAAGAAGRILSGLPEEAVALYVKRFGKTAEDLLAAVPEPESVDALRRIAGAYFHTPAGGRAAARLAALAFDRGDYLEAASLWSRLFAEQRRPVADRATILAKACVAYHMAGHATGATALRATAEKNHSSATITVGGRSVAMIPFLDRTLKSHPALASVSFTPIESWTSMAGSPAGVAVMQEADVSPFAVWNRPEPAEGLVADLFGSGEDVSGFRSGGRARAVLPSAPGVKERALDLPPLIHPVMAEGAVFCRREDAVVAVDAASGTELWRVDGVPMYEGEEQSGYGLRRPLSVLSGDMGRYALTLADGVLFSVCKFGRIDPLSYRSGQGGGGRSGSSLVALSADRNGAKLLWEVGNGTGADDSVRNAKYLTAPTWHAGSLFVLVRRASRYHAMCLKASDGTVVWDTPVGWVPLHGNTMPWRQAYVLEVLTERGSPVAVSGASVYLTTNTGLVLALGARTGELLWAYQYPSYVGGIKSRPTLVNTQGQLIRFALRGRPSMPVNPVIVSRGRVICLPCDSPEIFALDAHTGELLWRRERAGMSDLTAIGDSRLLLSGPDLLVLNAADGRELGRADGKVIGRPAVSAGAVLAAAEGRIVRMDLETFEAGSETIHDADAFLGGLLSAGGGMVISADAGGLSAFSGFDASWRALNESLEKARTVPERAEIRMRMGLTAVEADRLEESETCLAEARKMLVTAAEPAGFGVWRSRLCDAWLRRVAETDDRKKADAALRRGSELAASMEERIRALQASVTHVERFDGPRRALEAAQAMSERYAKGAGLDAVLYGAAWREAARIVRQHGDAACEALDAAARNAFQRLADKNDADTLAAFYGRWFHSRKGGEAIITAAELLFERAVFVSPPDIGLAMKASRLLGEACNSARSDIRRNAGLARAVIDLRLRPRSAAVPAGALRGGERDAAVRFADFRGTAADLDNRIRKAVTGPLPAEDSRFGYAALPLRRVYVSSKGDAVLRGTDSVPVRHGDRIFVWGGGKLACLDTQNSDYALGKVWSVGLRPSYGSGGPIGQITADGRRLAVMDNRILYVYDISSGGQVLSSELPVSVEYDSSSFAGAGDWLCVAEDRGTLRSVRVTDGSTAWEAEIPKLFRRIHVSGNMLLAGNSDRTLCLDVRTGRTIGSIQTPMDRKNRTVLTPDGFTVTVENGANAVVRDIRSANGGAIAVAAGKGNISLIGHGSRYVALRRTDDDTVRIIDMAEPGRKIEVALGKEGEKRHVPVRAAFLENRVILLHAWSIGKSLPIAPAISAFDLPAGNPVWTVELAPVEAGPCRVSRMAVFGDSVSLSVAPTEEGRPARQYVVNASTGAAFDAASSLPDELKGAPDAAVPVVLNGRVIVEHGGGIACLAATD